MNSESSAPRATSTTDDRVRLSAILETTPDLVALFTTEGCGLYLNQAGRKMLGVDPEAEVNLLRLVDFLAPGVRGYVLGEVISAAVRCGAWSGEFAMMDRHGRTIPVSAVCLGHESIPGQVEAISLMARDITERHRAMEEIRRLNVELEERVAMRTAQLENSLREKEVLLREIQHRVKNNLQVIRSVINLQKDRVQEPRVLAILEDTRRRVMSMAMVYQHLYESPDLAQVNLADYLERLIRDLFRSYQPHASTIIPQLQLEAVFIKPDQALQCGLILAELISNALKYAFPARTESASDRPDQIAITVRTGPQNTVCLRIKDNGIGFPAELDYRQTKTLGLQLVNSWAAQLHATLELFRGPGTEFILIFMVEP